MIKSLRCAVHVSIVATLCTIASTSLADEANESRIIVGNTAARVQFVRAKESGFDVIFEAASDKDWVQVAAYPAGQAWTVFCDWRASWYTEPHHVGVQRVEQLRDGRVRTSAESIIDGHRWQFADTFSLEAGLIKVERTFSHLSDGRQAKVTLETRVRVPQGAEPRVLIPGSIYNGNPSSTLPGPRLSMTSGAVGLYEEHRLPIPMVNIESTIAGRRLFGTLITQPSKIACGNRGDDHWWSMGVEYRQGAVDLVSVSGPVATNGKRSTIYGHRNGFDPYDNAYLNVEGQQRFAKTFFLDLGMLNVQAQEPQGYSFRSGISTLALSTSHRLHTTQCTGRSSWMETRAIGKEWTRPSSREASFCGSGRE